jgi:hypothetical protein
MPLHRLYLTGSGTGSLAGPNIGVLPGGAGVQVPGSTTNPGISAPRLEESTIEVLDVTAPTQLAAPGTANYGAQLGLPAAQGKLLNLSPTGAFGARWKLNSTFAQKLPRGQYGIVYVAGTPQVAPANTDAGYAASTAYGNETAFGTKALVMYDGPINAYVTGVGGIGISAGMALVADGGGNLTAVAAPAAGSVLATYLGPPIVGGISTPTLAPVYVGGY